MTASADDRMSIDEDASSDEEVKSGSEEEMLSASEPEKDATELELEKLVFGNATGFKDNIKGFKKALAYGEEVDNLEADEAQNDQLAVVDDADV